MHTAIIYVRQSTAKEESISLEAQETAAREYCDRYGYRIAEVIADEGISGLKWHQRSGIQRVLYQVENGDANRVIVWRWSRLSRKQLHQHLAIERIESAGAVVESAIEPFDTKTAGGAFGRDVMLASAAFESAQKSEQWREAHTYRVNSGVPASGRPRFGYTWYSKKDVGGGAERYEIDEKEAPIVRWLYEQYIEGRGVPSLTRELSRRGIMSKDGSPWKRSKLARYLESGFAAGYLVKTTAGSGENQHVVPFAKREFSPAMHEPIISEDTWQQFKDVKAGRATTPPRLVDPISPLSGLVRCGDCGGPMTRHVTKRRSDGTPAHISFTCSNRNAGKDVRSVTMAEHLVLSAVKEWLREVADDVGESASRAAQQQQHQLRNQADADTAARKVAEIDSQLANLTKQLVAGRVPEATYDATRDELLTERAQAEERRRLAKAAAEGDDTPAHRVAAGLLDEWVTMLPAKRAQLLRRLVEAVVVSPPESKGKLAAARVVAVWEDTD